VINANQADLKTLKACPNVRGENIASSGENEWCSVVVEIQPFQDAV